MTGGDPHDESGRVGHDPAGSRTDVSVSPVATPDRADADEPRLPGHVEQQPWPDQAPARRPGTIPALSAYRSSEERNRSLYRRANPWYRRVARGLIVVGVIAALGVGAYVGVDVVRGYLDRDQLPPADPEVPPIRATTILVASTSGELPLQGTLSFDTVSGAYEFVGLAGSPNEDDRLTNPDGTETYILNPNATWNVATGDEPIVRAVEHAISALADDTTADAILTSRLRSGYVELVDEVDEGPAADELTRYDVALDLTGFAGGFPVQWEVYRTNALPGAVPSPHHETALWLDDASILVRVQDAETGWNWERLAYSGGEHVPFRPPRTQVLDPDTQAVATGIDCRIDAIDIGWTTTVASCEESLSIGRELAASVGLADVASGPAAELAFATVCTALQGDEPQSFDDPAHVQLAGRLVDAGVCPGDTSLVVVGD